MTRVTFYGKAGCHLCEEAYAELESVRRDTPFELEVLDVSLDPRLHRQYGERIPVLDVDGQEALELGFGANSIRIALGRVGP
ncbi:MAG: glutaredoxin family protein [Thermoleophilaceae bacterium]